MDKELSMWPFAVVILLWIGLLLYSAWLILDNWYQRRKQ